MAQGGSHKNYKDQSMLPHLLWVYDLVLLFLRQMAGVNIRQMGKVNYPTIMPSPSLSLATVFPNLL